MSETKKEQMPEENGVRQPREGTVTGKVWKICDQVTGRKKRPATRAEVLEKTAEAEINDATAKTQYGQWCRFHGHTGRKVDPKEVAAKEKALAKAKAEKEKEKAAKAKAREAAKKVAAKEKAEKAATRKKAADEKKAAASTPVKKA